MGLFGGGQSYDNPADDAMPYLNQVGPTAQQNYNPYINFGKGAARVSAPIYYQMATDPQAYYNDTMNGYQQSDAYKYNQQQLNSQQAGTAAAGGFSGTPYDQQQQAYTTNGLLAQDQQQYYNNVTGAQQQGLNAGMHYYDTGYNATNNLNDTEVSNLNNQAGLAYQGATWEDQMNAQQRNNRNSLFGTTIGAGAGLIGMNGNNSYSNSNPNANPYIYGSSPRYY